MLGHSGWLLVALATTAVAADTEVASVSYRRWEVGQKFEIRTADHVYRGQLVDRATGQCRMSTSTDGQNFTSPSTVYLLGATAGRQQRQMLVLMHDVKVGMKMELGLGNLEQKHRQITSEVTAIRLE